jgi:Rad3-related DNA helicase
MKMTYGWDAPDKAKERKQLIEQIQNILAAHKNQSGIIHTGSFAVSKYIVEHLKNEISHKIFHHNTGGENPIARDGVIADFLKEDEPSILISPSITEGLDLKDALGRFSITVKTPYPFLGDAWVKKRMTLSQEWYNRQAMMGIIQGCGRIVRSSTDYGTAYILDASFETLFRAIKQFIPDWWIDGLEMK